MDNRKEDVLKYLDKKESREKLGKFFGGVILVFFVFFSGFYMLDLYMGAKNLTFLKFKINPEFGFIVNGNNEVVYYLPLNDDAVKIYNSDMFKGMNSEEAVSVAIEVAKENNYLLSEDRKIEVTVVSDNENVVKIQEEKVVSVIEKKDDKIVAEVVEATPEEIENFGKVDLDNIEDASSIIYVKTEENKFNRCDYVKVAYESLAGTDRFMSGVNVSRKMYPNGTKNVVLISYTDIVDGYLSVPLASKLDAPILMVKPDGITNEVLSEIERLKVSGVYVIGGTDVVSGKIDTVIKNKFNIDVKRIEGSHRYLTAINIAKEIDDFSSIVIAPNTNDAIDAAMVASVAGKKGMPIFYSDAKVVNKDLKEYIKSNKNINNIYLSGGTFTQSFIDEIDALGRNIEVLNGNDRYETNVLGISEFNSSFKNIVLVDNNVDAISASMLATKNNSVLFYTKNTINQKHIDLLKGNKIENIYYLGSNIYQPFKELLFAVKKNNVSSCENSVENLLFSTKKAVFYVPHQDDETLYYSQAITAAVDILGKENVYVVLVTDGNASAVKNNAFVKNGLTNYNSMHKDQLTFSSARDNEYRAALIEMGVENIHFIETFGYKRFNDSGFTKGTKVYNTNLETLKKFIKSYSSKYEDVTHFAYTFLDDHDDHEALGTALTSLYYDSSETGFENVYLIVKSTEMIGRNRHVTPDNTAKKYTRQDNILDKHSVVLEYSEGFDRIKKAFTKFGYYENNKECVADGELLGIGCVSVRSLFERISERLSVDAETPLETVIHIPYKK